MKISKVIGVIAGLTLVAGITAGCGANESPKPQTTDKGTTQVEENAGNGTVFITGSTEQNEVASYADEFWSAFYSEESVNGSKLFASEEGQTVGEAGITDEDATVRLETLPYAGYLVSENPETTPAGLWESVYVPAAVSRALDTENIPSRAVVDASKIVIDGDVARIPASAVETIVDGKKVENTAGDADLIVLVNRDGIWRVVVEQTNWGNH